MDKEMVARLVGLIESGLEPRASKPALRLVRPNEGVSGMDDITRESHCRMIRHLRRRWGFSMQLLIDQECFGLAGIEQLDDDGLERLHRTLERAQDCIRDGISFDDAGLIQSRYG